MGVFIRTAIANVIDTFMWVAFRIDDELDLDFRFWNPESKIQNL
jgi:hypothetical protein